MLAHYIFAYGSLINENSQAITVRYPEESIPVVVEGLRRGWYVRDKKQNSTFLGCLQDKKAVCNGLLFRVDEESLLSLDQRENEYSRVTLPWRMVGMNPRFQKNSIVWTYVVKDPQYPDSEYPIVQSYLDMVIEGCLQFGLSYAKTFLKTTDGWSYPLVDDRKAPRYQRALKNIDTVRVDAFLRKHSRPSCLLESAAARLI